MNMLNKTLSLAVLLLCVGAMPARAVMDGQGHDFFPVAAIFTASATITYTNAANAGLTVSSGLVVNNGTVALAASGGNVGIGTMGPGDKLHVAGYIRAQSASPQIRLANASNSLLWSIGALDGSTNKFHIYEEAGGGNEGYKVTVDTAGNVGIGTTGPGLLVHIEGIPNGFPATSGSTQTGGLRLDAAATFSDAVLDFGFANDVPGAWIQSTNKADLSTNYKLLLNPNGGNVGIGNTAPTGLFQVGGGSLTVLSSGKVGIGTTLPNSRLEIREDVLAWDTQGATISLSPVQNAGYAAPKAQITAFVPSVVGNSASGRLVFRTSDAGTLGDRVIITDTGKVGIGATNPGERLEVDGNIKITNGASYKSDRIVAPTNAAYYILNSDVVTGVRLDNGASSWAAQSDIRLKDIIEPINNSIQKVLAINPVIYRFKTDAPTVRRSGIIAQDVQRVLPEVVSVGDDDYLSVRYTELIPLLIGAIKEQQVRLDALSARLVKVEAGDIK